MLYYLGLIDKKDMREDFGPGKEIPECDSDLEDEIRLLENEVDERRDKIK
jgi:hypothetical protein